MSEELVRFLASYVVVGAVLSLGGWWVVDGRRGKEVAVAAGVAGVVAWLVTFLLKDLMYMPRPFLSNGGETLTVTMHGDGTFPSGHAALLFAIAFLIWTRSRVWGVIYGIVAVVVGVARVMANVHYPGDILAGAAVGIGAGWLVSRFGFGRVAGRLGGGRG